MSCEFSRFAKRSSLALAFAIMLAAGFLCAQENSTAQTPASEPARTCDPSGDVRGFIRLVAENLERNDQKARDYTYTQQSEVRRLDGNGTVKKTNTSTVEIMVIYGEAVTRTIEKDGKPLSPADQKKEEEKIDKLIRKRESETEEQKQERIAKFDKERAEGREFVNEVADAYNFTRLPDGEVSGRPTFVVDAQRLPGYKPRQKQARILPKFRFRVWVDQAECQFAKVDAEAIDTITYGGIIARIGKGSRVVIEQTRVNEEVWLTKSVSVKVGARLFLVKGMNMEIEAHNRDYRKFRSEHRVLGIVGEAEPQK